MIHGINTNQISVDKNFQDFQHGSSHKNENASNNEHVKKFELEINNDAY